MTDQELDQEHWEDWKAVDDADSRFYALLSKSQSEMLNKWCDAHDMRYRICWDEVTEMPALCAISSKKCEFSVPFTCNSTAEDVDRFMQLVAVHTVHGA